MFLRHPILSLVTFGYLGVVGWLTLAPQVGSREESLLWRIALYFDRYEATEWFTFNRLEFMANMAMFVPIGLFFVLLFGRNRWWLAILISVLLTTVIETVQLSIPSRVSDPRDLLSNSLGAIVGTLLALMLTAAKARQIRLARTRPAPLTR